MTDNSLLIDLLKGSFGIFVAAHILSLHKGYFKFSEEKERVRKKLVEKYGNLMLIVSFVAVVYGLTYIIRAMKRFIIGN